MTREEAKQVLNKARPILATEELRTAIDMAIEALANPKEEFESAEERTQDD